MGYQFYIFPRKVIQDEYDSSQFEQVYFWSVLVQEYLIYTAFAYVIIHIVLYNTVIRVRDAGCEETEQ